MSLLRCLVRLLRPGVLVALCVFIVWTPQAIAHEISPAIASLKFADGGAFELDIAANLEALVAAIGPEHQDSTSSPNAAEYDRLRALPPADLEAAYAAFADRYLAGVFVLGPDGERLSLQPGNVLVEPVGDRGRQRTSVVTFSGRVPSGANTLRWRYDEAFGPSVIRASIGDGEVFFSDYVLDGEPSGDIDVSAVARQSRAALFADYLQIGFRHIVPDGLDHILFVLGLFLLSPKLKPLLWQVTCFTIAHSVTLALGSLGVLQAPAGLVQALVALSIVYVAVENVWTDRLSRWRPLVIFLFGLVHGLGFAGVLADVGLSGVDFAVGLVAFNIGVELGQLAVVGGAFLAVGLWFGHEAWYRRFLAIPASLAIAAVGAFWFVERIV